MNDAPLHTLNIQIPSPIVFILKELYDLVGTKYENKYPLLNNWEPHIDIYTIRVSEEDSETYVNEIKEIDLYGSLSEIELTGFSLSNDKKYIFIELSETSKKQVLELRGKLETALNKYRSLEIPLYFRERWDTYSEEQKAKITKTGSLYDYVPHISLIKLNPVDSEKALKDIENKFTPISFIPEDLKLNKQTFDERDMFETKLVKKNNPKL